MIAVTLNARNVPDLRMPNAQGNFCAVALLPDHGTLWQAVAKGVDCGLLLPAMGPDRSATVRSNLAEAHQPGTTGL